MIRPWISSSKAQAGRDNPHKKTPPETKNHLTKKHLGGNCNVRLKKNKK